MNFPDFASLNNIGIHIPSNFIFPVSLLKTSVRKYFPNENIYRLVGIFDLRFAFITSVIEFRMLLPDDHPEN